MNKTKKEWTGGQEFIAWSDRMLKILKEITALQRERNRLYIESLKRSNKLIPSGIKYDG